MPRFPNVPCIARSVLDVLEVLLLLGGSYDKVAVGGREFQMGSKTRAPYGVAILSHS